MTFLNKDILFIDGSYGEGGGQILRSALSLSMLLNIPFRMINIRSSREKSGLQKQHLTAVLACAEISSASVKGANIGSKELEFIPNNTSSGRFSFDTGTAASTTLILQGLILPLIFTRESSTLKIIGGTNNPKAPSVLFLQHVFIPIMRNIGTNIEVSIDKYGWYPRGGGILRATIHPVKKLKPIQINDRGGLRHIRGIILLSDLPASIAERGKKQCLKRIFEFDQRITVDIEMNNISDGKGLEIFLCAEYD
ncbi:MAG: RNA 3'-terminal phosphate cyclase, partial [Candidatus Bathyarchaeia archaeon]